MIAGDVWVYVEAAYVVTALLLGGVAFIVFLRARYWARRARELDRKS